MKSTVEVAVCFTSLIITRLANNYSTGKRSSCTGLFKNSNNPKLSLKVGYQFSMVCLGGREPHQRFCRILTTVKARMRTSLCGWVCCYPVPLLSPLHTALFLHLHVFQNKGIWSQLGENHNALRFNRTVKRTQLAGAGLIAQDRTSCPQPVALAVQQQRVGTPALQSPRGGHWGHSPGQRPRRLCQELRADPPAAGGASTVSSGPLSQVTKERK